MVIVEDARPGSRRCWSRAASGRSNRLLHEVSFVTPTGNPTLIVMVDPTVARELRSSQTGAGRADRLREMVRDTGLHLDPLHPDSTNTGPLAEDLASFFVIAVPAGADVDQLVQRLQSLPEVHAAYVKPHDEAP